MTPNRLNRYISQMEAHRRKHGGEHLQRLREAAASADKGEGIDLGGMSRDELRRQFSREP